MAQRNLAQRDPHPRLVAPAAVSAPRRNGKPYLYLGLGLFGMLLIALGGEIRWTLLTNLQNNDLYKQITGFALLAFSVYQWRFSLLRARGLNLRAAAMAQTHKWVGATAPAFFWLHSAQVGHAYQFALSLVFLTLFASGLGYETLRVYRREFRTAWLVVHVSLASVLPFLLGYHVFITYTYE